MKAIRLSALRTGRLYPKESTPCTHFYYRLNRTGKFVNEKSKCPSGIEPATFWLVAQHPLKMQCIIVIHALIMAYDRRNMSQQVEHIYIIHTVLCSVGFVNGNGNFT